LARQVKMIGSSKAWRQAGSVCANARRGLRQQRRRGDPVPAPTRYLRGPGALATQGTEKHFRTLLSRHCDVEGSPTGNPQARHEIVRRIVMGTLLHWAIIFLVVALVAAFLGFGGVAGTAMGGAQMLFWVAIVLFVVSVVAGLIRRA
jgi:uncharacterized membrane protein YtjA (UPF0391 family)